MTRLSTLLTALMIAVLLTSCAGPSVIRYEEENRQPKPFDFPIPVLDKAKIDRPYKIIGQIQIDTSKSDFATLIVEQLKDEARKLGGDALIDLQKQPLETSFSFGAGYPINQHDLSYSGHFRDLWMAKVIVWQNP